MTAPQITETVTKKLKFSTDVDGDRLKEFADSLPSGSKVRVEKYNGDVREPTESVIVATWEI